MQRVENIVGNRDSAGYQQDMSWKGYELLGRARFESLAQFLSMGPLQQNQVLSH